jgi:hypothetical protein
MHKVTVRDAQRYLIADGETQIRDVKDDGEVHAAGRRVCEARGRKLPQAGTIKVEVLKGRTWQPARTLAI